MSNSSPPESPSPVKVTADDLSPASQRSPRESGSDSARPADHPQQDHKKDGSSFKHIINLPQPSVSETAMGNHDDLVNFKQKSSGLVLISQTRLPIFYTDISLPISERVAYTISPDLTYCAAVIIAMSVTGGTETSEAVRLRATIELMWPNADNSDCLERQEANKILDKAIIGLLREMWGQDRQSYDRYSVMYLDAVVDPMHELPDFADRCIDYFLLAAHVRFFPEYEEKVHYYDLPKDQRILSSSRFNNLCTCFMLSVVGFTQRGQVTQQKLDKICSETYAGTNIFVSLTDATVQAYYEKIKSSVSSSVARMWQERMKSCITLEDNLALHLLFDKMPKTGLSQFYWIKKSMSEYPWFSWSLVKEKFPSDDAFYHKASNLIKDDEFYGYNQDLKDVKASNYPRLAYLCFRIQKDVSGHTTLQDYRGKFLLSSSDKAFCDNLVDEMLKTLKTEALDAVFAEMGQHSRCADKMAQ